MMDPVIMTNRGVDIRHHPHATAAAVLAAAFLVACGSTSSPTSDSASPGKRDMTSSPSSRPPIDALPDGMLRLGAELPRHAEEPWVIKTSPLKTVQATVQAKNVPKGWRTAALTLTLTNTSDQVEPFPDLTVSGRYGPEGRDVAQFTDTGITGIADTQGDASDREQIDPGRSALVRIGVAVPSTAVGQPSTFRINDAWFEGAFPGTPNGRTTLDLRPAENKGVLPFGTWSSAGPLRLSQPIAGSLDSQGNRDCSLEVSFFNTGTSVNDQRGVNHPEYILRVRYGEDATAASDYAKVSAWVAPQRAATGTVHFTLPAKAVPGPITIEVEARSLQKPTIYEGEISGGKGFLRSASYAYGDGRPSTSRTADHSAVRDVAATIRSGDVVL